MSNPVNVVFIDVLVTLEQFIGRRFSNAYKDYTSKGVAFLTIDWNPRFSTCNRFEEPFLDTDGDGYWDITVDAGRISGTVTNANARYSLSNKQYYLSGRDTKDKYLSAPMVKTGFADKKPLEAFYPKLEDILNNRVPQDFVFFVASLAFTLNRRKGMSMSEFMQRWEYVIVTGDMGYMHSEEKPY